jgi:hypothetical protein
VGEPERAVLAAQDVVEEAAEASGVAPAHGRGARGREGQVEVGKPSGREGEAEDQKRLRRERPRAVEEISEKGHAEEDERVVVREPEAEQ